MRALIGRWEVDQRGRSLSIMVLVYYYSRVGWVLIWGRELTRAWVPQFKETH